MIMYFSEFWLWNFITILLPIHRFDSTNAESWREWLHPFKTSAACRIVCLQKCNNSTWLTFFHILLSTWIPWKIIFNYFFFFVSMSLITNELNSAYCCSQKWLHVLFKLLKINSQPLPSCRTFLFYLIHVWCGNTLSAGINNKASRCLVPEIDNVIWCNAA